MPTNYTQGPSITLKGSSINAFVGGVTGVEALIIARNDKGFGIAVFFTDPFGPHHHMAPRYAIIDADDGDVYEVHTYLEVAVASLNAHDREKL